MCTTCDNDSFRSEVDNLLLAFNYSICWWRGRWIRNDREICFEDLSDDLSISHQVHGYCTMLWHINSFASTDIRVMQEVIADII